MYRRHRVGLVLLAVLASIAVSAATASAQFVTGFESPTYFTGPLLGQEEWTGGPNVPRVQTDTEIAAELEAAGLNPDNPVHSGSQALLMTYTIGETTGGFLRRPFTGLEFETNVVMDWWARPLTPGSEGSTIGFNQGNTFVGLFDDNEVRAAAVRFGVVRDTENQIIGTTIDYGSAIVGDAVWVPSGLTWEADTWYNFRFELDYAAKQYDFYVNDTQVNTEPILFYNTSSLYAARVFISRGTNQAGQILDDISVTAAAAAVPGDYNNDGVVDAADYTAWRDNVGAAAGTLPNDTDGGVIGQAQYNTWVANFGMGSGSGSGGAAVPEPTSVALAACMALLLGAGRLSRRRS